ncbi:hypothetical protein [Aphanothece minutissima]|uniref:Uncharacterized protein n=1 Tax=Aphanothece cf. minutissima CCALA 015 TaxID=2107695 RepID=A0ABX5F9J2_9CHRO|nr:hypothetical protein [Aphanothece minutissima]PSB37059.1 hypothetical protein C7B81_11675 [Aphanothece cf. minutissima CCALA 015]
MTIPPGVGPAPAPNQPIAAAPAAAATPPGPAADPVLCHHCGRTAGNGISCQGICVADSGY